jgi:hypothetical protein
MRAAARMRSCGCGDALRLFRFHCSMIVITYIYQVTSKEGSTAAVRRERKSTRRCQYAERDGVSQQPHSSALDPAIIRAVTDASLSSVPLGFGDGGGGGGGGGGVSVGHSSGQ